MKKTFIACIIAVALCINFSNIEAAVGGQLDVNVKVINANTAELTIVYPTPFVESTFNILPSKMTNESGIESTYKLTKIVTSKGEKRGFGDFQDGLSDAIAYIDAKDTSISVTYMVTNALSLHDVSLFKFPLVLGGNYPSMARVRVSYPSSMGLLSYPNSEKMVNIPVKVDTIIAAPFGISEYFVKDLTFLLYKKSTSKTGYVYKKIGNFSLVSPKNLDVAATAIVKALVPVVPEYVKILGQSLPQNTVILVAPVGGATKDYENAALQLSKNIILFDSAHMGPKLKEYTKKIILAHELTHVATANAQLFRGEPIYSAKMFDEGMATFMGEYLAEKYFLKNAKKSDIEQLPNGYRKMKKEEYMKQFNNSFDYTFSIITGENQNIEYTYGHSGLIFHTLFERDKNIIPRLTSELKNVTSAGNCGVCDSETVINTISRLTGLKTEDIIYPNKADLLSGTISISNLLIDKVLLQ